METQQCILIVEDDEAVREVLMVALRAHGYTVATAATVREAEATLQQLGPMTIGLVISDINLTSDPAAREGYALYHRWTTAHPTLAYLLISGNPTNAALPAIRDGSVAFLAKPFGINELLDMVQAFLTGHTHDHKGVFCPKRRKGIFRLSSQSLYYVDNISTPKILLTY